MFLLKSFNSLKHKVVNSINKVNVLVYILKLFLLREYHRFSADIKLIAKGEVSWIMAPQNI